MGESDLTNGNANTVSVTLQPSNSICQDATIVIRELTGTQTVDNPTLAIGGSGATLVGSTGAWIQITGTLTMTISKTLMFEFGSDRVFTFVLTNHATGQCPRFPIIEATGETHLQRVFVCVCVHARLVLASPNQFSGDLQGGGQYLLRCHLKKSLEPRPPL